MSTNPAFAAKRRVALMVTASLSFCVAVYAWWMYGPGPGAERLHPDMRATFERHALAIHLHIFASSLALLIGPFQFSQRLRAQRPALHRWLGRTYLLVGVGLGGMAGLWMSRHAHGGPVAQIGFASLALAWLYTGVRAYASIRQGDVAAHRQWMVRNMALTLAAVTLRLYLPWVFVFSWPFTSSYAAIAWLCWLPNLVVAQCLLKERP
jgi:uncharacterized membrane protein